MNFDPSRADTSGPGTFSAAIATLAPFVDLQGDVTLASAFDGNGTVYLSDWEHSSFDPNADKRPPVGVATISVVGNRAVATGTFFETEAGQACRALLKAAKPQFSYGFVILKASTDPALLKAYPGARRILQRLAVLEVSPVALGAGGPEASALWAKHEIESAQLASVRNSVPDPEQDELHQIWLRNLARQFGN